MNIKVSELKEVLSYLSDDDLIALDGVYKSDMTVLLNHGGYAQIQFRKENKDDMVNVTIVGNID